MSIVQTQKGGLGLLCPSIDSINFHRNSRRETANKYLQWSIRRARCCFAPAASLLSNGALFFSIFAFGLRNFSQSTRHGRPADIIQINCFCKRRRPFVWLIAQRNIVMFNRNWEAEPPLSISFQLTAMIAFRIPIYWTFVDCECRYGRRDPRCFFFQLVLFIYLRINFRVPSVHGRVDSGVRTESPSLIKHRKHDKHRSISN